MERFEYTPSSTIGGRDFLQLIDEIEIEQRSDGFLWTNEYTNKMIDTIDKLQTEISCFRSSSGFENSYYSAPNVENEDLLSENDELRSQIIEVESVVNTIPGFEDFFRTKEEIELEYDGFKTEREKEINQLKEIIREREFKLVKLQRESDALKSTTKSSNFGVYDYNEIKKQVEDLEKQLDTEK